MTKHVSTGRWGGWGAHSDIWQCNYMVTSRDNTGTWVALDIVWTLIQRLQTKTSTGREFITAALQTDRGANLLPQLIPATNWKLLLSETFLRFIIKLKTNTEKRSPVWVQIPVSNPVLINSTIKFVCLNDRQDVEIRMLCGYWVVWEQDQVALSDSIAIFFVFVYLVSVYLVCIKIKANIEYWIRITQRTDIGQALSI